MQEVNDFLKLIDGFIGSADWFVYFLLGTGLFFTIYLKFPQIRYFRHAIRIVKGKYDGKNDTGDTSHFQALSTALSGTVGTGNIAGVALAIHLGGPAALFWMLITAMLGMTTKFVEVTLSHKYREKASDGSIAGGPMYYMKNKLKMKWLAAIFAIATILSSFGTGSLPQINNIAEALNSTFGIQNIVTGGVLAVLLGFVIVGGIKRIAKVTERLVPSMAIIYLVGAIAVLASNYDNIVPSFISIFSDVFTGSAAMGGFLGASIMFAFNRGVNRGLFSNEAGQGSAPIAHAAARANEPVSEGMVAILEPFIDTVVICMITGLVILSSGVWTDKFDNKFQTADLVLLDSKYDEDNADDKKKIFQHLTGEKKLPLLNADIKVENGEIEGDFTIIHARSYAEDVKVYIQIKDTVKLFVGNITIKNGQLKPLKNSNNKIWFEGKSLLHSAPLTIEAFKKSVFKDWGQYIVSIGLLLFAFSTAISWSYYGGRSVTYLWGTKYVIYYRIIYVIAFFFASFADTMIIWTLSGITIALMTIPNLIGILILRKDVKETIKTYWDDFNKNHSK